MDRHDGPRDLSRLRRLLGPYVFCSHINMHASISFVDLALASWVGQGPPQTIEQGHVGCLVLDLLIKVFQLLQIEPAEEPSVGVSQLP